MREMFGKERVRARARQIERGVKEQEGERGEGKGRSRLEGRERYAICWVCCPDACVVLGNEAKALKVNQLPKIDGKTSYKRSLLPS